LVHKALFVLGDGCLGRTCRLAFIFLDLVFDRPDIGGVRINGLT